MDTPQSAAAKEKNVLTKLWKRIKTSFRTKSTKNPSSLSRNTPTMPAPTPQATASTVQSHSEANDMDINIETQSAIIAAPRSTPQPASTVLEPIEVDDEQQAGDEEFELSESTSVTTQQASTAIAAIFAKYGVQYDPDQFPQRPKPGVERVERKPRLRVRYTCHECKTTFGSERSCKKCNHQRCRDCVRYPPKRKNKAKAVRDSSTIKPIESTAASIPKTGPCHECQTQFGIGDTECSNCHHKICGRCLSEAVEDASGHQPQPQAIS